MFSGLFLTPLSRLRERGWGRGCFDGLPDSFEHAFRLIHHFVVPETQHSEPLPGQPRITFAIIGDLIAVLAAVEFDHQGAFETSKIDDVRAEWLLTLEFQAEEAVGAQEVPQTFLRDRLRLAHGFCVVQVGHA